MIWTKPAHFVIGRCPREGTTLCPAAKADETSLRPAIRVRISSTKRGPITNCAKNSTRSRRSKPMLASRSSFAGSTGSRKERSSGLDAIESEPAIPTADSCSRKRVSPLGASLLEGLGSPLVSRRPFPKPPKHCPRCICSVIMQASCNSRWGIHFLNSYAVEPALKQVS